MSLCSQKQSIPMPGRRIIWVKSERKPEVFLGTLPVPTVGEQCIGECRVRLSQGFVDLYSSSRCLLDLGHDVPGKKRSVVCQEGVAVRQSSIGKRVLRVLLDRSLEVCNRGAQAFFGSLV